jgi:hypothetical protein
MTEEGVYREGTKPHFDIEPIDPGHGLRWLARIVLTEKLRVGSGRAG